MIPKRFEGVTLDNYVPVTPSQRAAHRAVRDWIENVDAGPMLALIGSQGTGKSHLLYSAVREIVRRIDSIDPRLRVQQGVAYPFAAPWYSLADQLRYGVTIQTESGSRQRDGHEVRAQLWNRRVALLDEVRRTSGTEFDDSELAKFACHAYDNRIAVLITTNVHPLDAVMGPAAASRFSQVVIDGPDARQAA